MDTGIVFLEDKKNNSGWINIYFNFFGSIWDFMVMIEGSLNKFME